MTRPWQFIATVGLMLAVGGVATKVDSAERFRDDFTGSSLHPSWLITNEKRDRWTLIENDYLFIVSGPEGINVFRYGGKLPGRYVVEIGLTVDLRDLGCDWRKSNEILLGISDDKERAVGVYVGQAVGNACEEVGFTKWTKDERSSIHVNVDKMAREIRLMLVKGDVEIEGLYDIGNGWTSIGRQFIIGMDGKPYFTVFNAGPNAPDTGVRVDYVEIRPE